MKTPHVKLIDRSPLRLGFIFFSIIFVWFALSPQARAVDPPPGGDYWAWKAGGSLNTARAVHTATLLQNGMVLVAGGQDSNGPSVSAELYDPASRTWTVTGSLNTAHYYHTATLLQNGMVLVAGGQASNRLASASVEVYSPASGTWITTGFLHVARRRHTATSLQDGKVLVAGGLDPNSRDVARAELGRPPP